MFQLDTERRGQTRARRLPCSEDSIKDLAEECLQSSYPRAIPVAFAAMGAASPYAADGFKTAIQYVTETITQNGPASKQKQQ